MVLLTHGMDRSPVDRREALHGGYTYVFVHISQGVIGDTTTSVVMLHLSVCVHDERSSWSVPFGLHLDGIIGNNFKIGEQEYVVRTVRTIDALLFRLSPTCCTSIIII